MAHPGWHIKLIFTASQVVVFAKIITVYVNLSQWVCGKRSLKVLQPREESMLDLELTFNSPSPAGNSQIVLRLLPATPRERPCI